MAGNFMSTMAQDGNTKLSMKNGVMQKKKQNCIGKIVAIL